MSKVTENLLSIVIPCYGSELTVKGVIDEIVTLFGAQTKYDYEIVAVNDGSPDNVISVLRKCAEENHKVKVIDLAINSGKHNALLAGFSHVSGSVAITIDDDGQCPVDRLWDLIAPLEQGYDMAMARYDHKNEGAVKKIGSSVNNRMSRWLLNKPKGLKFTNFIARKRFVVDAMCNYHLPYTYLEGLSLKTTRRIALVDMQERNRVAGKSGYTFFKSFKLMMNGYTSFSTKPLHIIGLFGFIFTIAGFIYMLASAICSICKAMSFGAFQFNFLIAVLLFLTGVILLALALIGEYVGRTFVAQNNANQYVIRDTINFDEGE